MSQSLSEQKTIYLHLGLHKTGTSFLQAQVFPKIEELDVKNKHKFIYDISTESNKSKILFTEEDYSVSMPHKRHKFECTEALVNFKKIYPDAKIIVGFRNKEDWLRSCYSQYVFTFGGYLSFEKYLQKYEKDILNFEEYLQEIRRLWTEVFVYQFEELKKNPDVLIKKLCDFMNCSVPEYENKRYNISMNKNQIFFLRLINRIFSVNGKMPGYKIVVWFLYRLRKPVT